MFLIKNIINYFIISNIIIRTNSLVELPSVEDNDILTTESVIRNTINKLFSNLKLTVNNKLKEYATVHNYLTSLTLKDHENLKEIAKLSKIDRRNINKTEYFIALINGILDEDDKINKLEENNKIIKSDENLTKHIKGFIDKLEYLKGTNVNKGYSNLVINPEVLKHLKDESVQNNTDMESLKPIENESILSDNEFWQPSGRRIYRGDRTKIKYFPFMVAIQIFQKFQCGGSIIKSDLIISAASCLQLAWNNRFFRENPAFLSVQVGSNFYSGGGDTISILEVYFHPDYNPKNLRNNLCLLRLSRRLKFRRQAKRVKKIDIDRTPSKLPLTTDGITIVGWGAKGTSNIILDPWENRITYAVLDFYPLRECQDIYSSEYVTKKNFCAGFFSKGGGACNRDVGGPGIVNGILTGVVSFGSPVCGAPDAPTVFTKLGHYADWIDEIMDQDVPHGRKRTTLKPPFSSYGPIREHTYETRTTFKIAPIGGAKMKPIPISQQDVLRILDDEKNFDEFLRTMFSEKEIEQYQDLFKDDKEDVETKTPNITMKYPIVPTKELEIAEPTTKMDFEEYDSVTKTNKKYTVLDENKNTHLENKLEKDLVNLMASINLGEAEELKEASESDQVTDKLERNVLKETKRENIASETNKKKNVDNILTLLYISDSEKRNNAAEDVEDQGLSIPTDAFKDLKYRNNGTEIFDFLPKSVLYDLLTETIDETKNKA